MWIHSIVNVLLLFLLVLSSVDFFGGESPRFIFCIFAHRWLCESPSTGWFDVSLIVSDVYSACPRVWTAITANDGQLFSHEDDGASPHPHGQKLRHPNQKKKMWCNESHVVGAPKKKIKEKEATTTTPVYTRRQTRQIPTDKQPQKTPNSMRHPISPPSIHPSIHPIEEKGRDQLFRKLAIYTNAHASHFAFTPPIPNWSWIKNSKHIQLLEYYIS